MNEQALLYTVRFMLAPITVWLFYICGIGCRSRRRALALFAGFCAYLAITSYLLICAIGFYPFSRISVFLTFLPTVIIIPLAISKDRVPQSLFMLITAQNVVLLVTLTANLVRSLLDLDLTSTIALIVAISVPLLILALKRFAAPLRYVAAHVRGHWLAMNAMPLLICALTIALSVYGEVRFHDEPFLATGVSVAFEALYLFFILMLYRNLRDIDELSARLRTEDLVRVQVLAMEKQLQLLDDQERLARIEAHDRRHVDRMLAELISQGETARALEVLGAREQPQRLPRYCLNATINAVVAFYAAQFAEEDIAFEVRLDIPAELACDSIELSIVVSNLLENALHACERVAEETNTAADAAATAADSAVTADSAVVPWARFTAAQGERLMMQIENAAPLPVAFDEEGLPVSPEEGHGIGTRSVVAFAQRTGALVDYRWEDSIFRVRLIV